MGKAAIGEIYIIVLVIYKPPKNFHKSEQLFNEKNEGAIKMLWETARRTSQIWSGSDSETF